MVKTENARRGHSFEEMLKDYIDCEKDNDATSKVLTDMPDVNRMSEGNSSEPTEVEHVVTTINVDDVFEIECTSVAEEIIIEDEKVFDTSSPNSEVVEVIGNESVEELQTPIIDDVNEITTDENINSKHVLMNNEFDTFFDKIPANNGSILVDDLMEIDPLHVNKTTSRRTEDVKVISRDTPDESISPPTSTKKTTKPKTNDNKRAEISQSNPPENTIEQSTNGNKTTEISASSSTKNTTETVAVSQSSSSGNAIDSNINDIGTVANETTDKPYKCHICGKCFSRASSRKCHIRLHVEGPDSLLRGSSQSVENSLKAPFVDLTTKKEEVVEPVADETPLDTVPDDETGSNVLISSRDSCDLTEDEEKREYKCIVCEKTFSRRSSLTCHYKFHPKSPVSKNQEDISVQTMRDENTMDVDRAEELYKCDKCPRTFSQKNTYVWHTKMHETNVRKESTDSSAAPAVKLTNGVDHTEMVDITTDDDENYAQERYIAELDIYKCHLCPRSFASLRGLKTHSGVHRKKPVEAQPNRPEGLNQIFYEEVSSRKNVCWTKNHNHDDEITKLYKCNVCCKCFCDINNLKAHLTRNHQEDTSEASDAELVVESSLRTGTAQNEFGISNDEALPGVDEYFKDEKPPIIIPGLYKCGVCSETFDEIQLLGEHVNIHIQAHNESLLNITDDSVAEELNCVVCEKTFRNQNALSRHMNEHRRREEEILVRVTSSGRKIRERRSSDDLIFSSPIKCIPCNRTFESVRAKNTHDSAKHPVEQPDPEEPELASGDEADDQQEEYICECCNRPWANIRSLARHRGWAKQRSSVVETILVDELDPLEPDAIPVEENKTENDVSSSVKCGCCNELFPNIPALNAHLSGQVQGTITEPGFSSPSRERTEMQNCDSLRDLIKCDRCDKFCSGVQGLKLHIIADHTKKSVPQSSANGQPLAASKVPDDEIPIQKDKSTDSADISSKSNDQTVEKLVIIRSKVKRSQISVDGSAAGQNSTPREEPTLEKPFQCDLCGRTFKSTITLNYHRSTHDDEEEEEEETDTWEVDTFICCGKTFATLRALKIHQHSHSSNKSADIVPVPRQKSSAKAKNTDTESEEDLFKEYKCSICDKVTTSKKALRYHREKHFKPGMVDPEFNGEFSCDKCLKRFDKLTSLRVHKAYHTTVEKNSNGQPIDYGWYSDLRNGIFKCSECNREFNTVKGVLKHFTLRHKEPGAEPEPEPVAKSKPKPKSKFKFKEYSCPRCDRKFPCSQGLAGHMSHHISDCICKICKKTYSNKANLQRHEKLGRCQPPKSDTEEEEEEIEEEEEEEELEEENSEDEYACIECNRKFATHRGLNGHMQMHQLYSCLQCNLEFHTFRSYSSHMESDHNEPAKSNPLRAHKAGHGSAERKEAEKAAESEPEFKCAICDRVFLSARSLGGHKSMHSRNGEEAEPEDSENEAEPEDSENEAEPEDSENEAEPEDSENESESVDEDADNEEDQSNEFTCTRCERTFLSARSLIIHKNSHNVEDNPLALICPQPQCERIFISHRALSAHFLAHRPEDSLQVFSCPICNEPFKIMKTMYAHFNAEHEKIEEVERVSRRSLTDAISSDTEKPAMLSRSRSQVAPPAVVETRKTRSKSVGDKVSSRDEKLVSSTRSSEAVNMEKAPGSSEPFIEEKVACSSEPVIKEKAACSSEPVTEEEATHSSEPVNKERATRSSERVTEEKAAHSSEPVTRERTARSSERVTEEKAARSSEPVTKEKTASSSEPVTRERAARSSERVTEEKATRSSEPVTRERAARSSERVTEEKAARSSERLSKEKAARISEPATKEKSTRSSDAVNKDDVEETCSTSVRKSLRLKSSSASAPSLLKQKDDPPTEVDTDEDEDSTKVRKSLHLKSSSVAAPSVQKRKHDPSTEEDTDEEDQSEDDDVPKVRKSLRLRSSSVTAPSLPKQKVAMSTEEDTDEDDDNATKVRKSLRLRSSSAPAPIVSKRKDSQPREVDTDEEDHTTKVRKSLRLRSSSVTKPSSSSSLKQKDDPPMEVDTDEEDTTKVRKSLRLRSSSVTKPSSKQTDNPPKEVDSDDEKDENEDDDSAKDNMQLSCVFNDCSESTNYNSRSKPKCNMCSLAFNGLKGLAKHLADSHKSTINPIHKKFEVTELQIRIHKCDQCDETFPNRVGLRRHSLSHTVKESENLATGVEQSPVEKSGSKTKSSKLTERKCVEETESSKSKADRTMAKQSANESKSSKIDVDQTVARQSVEDAVCSESNVNQSKAEQSAKEAEYSKSNVDQTGAKKSVSKTEPSKSIVDQTVAKKSVSQTEPPKSIVDQTVAKKPASKTEPSKSSVDQSTTEQFVAKQSVNKPEDLKFNINRNLTKEPVNKPKCSMSNVDQAEQSVDEIEHSESNVDQTMTEKSVKEKVDSKSNVDQIVSKESVDKTEGSKSNIDQTVTEQSIRESKCSKSNVDQIVAKKSSVGTIEPSKSIVDQTVAKKSVSKTEPPKSIVDQTVAKKSVNVTEPSKSIVDQTVAKKSVSKTEPPKSIVAQTVAKKSVSQTEPPKSIVDQTVAKKSVNSTELSKSIVDQTVAKQPVGAKRSTDHSVSESKRFKSNVAHSVKEIEYSKSKINQPSAEQPERLTNGVPESTPNPSAPSSKSTDQKSHPSPVTSAAQKVLPVKVSSTKSTDLKQTLSTNNTAAKPPPATPPTPSKPDALLSCKLCSRQFGHVKAFNKHQQWHKFNDQAVEIEETIIMMDEPLPPPASSSPLINGTANLEVLAYVKCDICQEKFTRADTLKKHAFDMHTVIITSPILYQCNYCHKPFPRGKTLFLHLQSHGPNNSPNISTNSPASEEIMPFECVSCEKCFRLKDDLLEHVKTHLADSQPTPQSYQPLVNGSTEKLPHKVNGDSPSASNLGENDELKIHSEDPANDTLKEPEQATESTPRLDDTTDRKFQCPICNKRFQRQNNLTYHLRSHDHEKKSHPALQPTIRRRSVRLTDDVQMSIISPPKQHQCTQCNESFRSKIILEMHSQKHSIAQSPKQSTAKSSRKTVKRPIDGDDFPPEDGPSSGKRRVSKDVS